MADRYFPNPMPDFVPESSFPDDTTSGEDSLLNLLFMDYKFLSATFERQGLDIKETVVIQTWGRTGQNVADFSLYSGTLGTAFLLFRVYQLTGNVQDLNLSAEIIRACDRASSTSSSFFSLSHPYCDVVTFLCGRAGVCGLGAVVAKYAENEESLNYYLSQFKQVQLTKDLPDELLYGRCGYLWACLFINKHIGPGTIPSDILGRIADEIIERGRAMPNKGSWPLMFEWFGERYWGAAHGLAGIMYVLMQVDLKPDQHEDVKNTLLLMIKHRFPNGNYPSSEENSRSDVLVHWCHGAPGIALTFVRAYEVFREKAFLEAAVNASEVVWNRGLLKRVGVCHGVSGNAYVFLALYRITGSLNHLYRAKAFACFLLDRAHKLIDAGEMHGGDNPYSLFEGMGGMASLFLDMVEPVSARFPAYEL